MTVSHGLQKETFGAGSEAQSAAGVKVPLDHTTTALHYWWSISKHFNDRTGAPWTFGLQSLNTCHVTNGSHQVLLTLMQGGGISGT
jgi:hypothetical protein